MMEILWVSEGIKLGNIKAIELTPVEVENKYSKMVLNESYSTEFNFTIKRKQLLKVLYGISNNYLKMHGQPMIRRWE